MGGVGNFPFPSFTLLLTSDRVIIPGPSYVIRFAPLVNDTLLSPSLNCSTKMQTDNNVDGDMVEDYYPLANLDFENDSVSFPSSFFIRCQ